MKQSLQNKNSPVTVSVHILQTAIYIRQIAISQYSAEYYFKFYMYRLFY